MSFTPNSPLFKAVWKKISTNDFQVSLHLIVDIWSWFGGSAVFFFVCRWFQLVDFCGFPEVVVRRNVYPPPPPSATTENWNEQQLPAADPVSYNWSWSLQQGFTLWWAVHSCTASPMRGGGGVHMLQDILWNSCTWRDCSSLSTHWCTAQ